MPAEARGVAQSDRDQPINPSVLKTLAALQRERRPDILSTLITLFLDNARDLLQDLEKGAREADFALLGQASHALGSASANIGASPLAALNWTSDCRAVRPSTRAREKLATIP